jgi:hypothetical protein
MPRKHQLSLAAALTVGLLFHEQIAEWAGAALFLTWLFLTS